MNCKMQTWLKANGIIRGFDFSQNKGNINNFKLAAVNCRRPNKGPKFEVVVK